jgi:tripartite-type tricarboxylate transporter receptor subunit TctC
VIEKVNAALRAATQQPKVQEVAVASGVVLKPLTAAEMDTMARRDVEILTRVVREAGLRLE